MKNVFEKKEHAKNLIKQLRTLFPTVDSALQHSTPFEFLVAVILSAQNTDKGVNKVTSKLFEKYKNITDYVAADLDVFTQDLKSINYYRTKAKNILQTAKIIQDTYHGKLPDSMEKLLELPGVGRKTANVILGNVFKSPAGIAVDTHVRRLAQLYGLTDETHPEKIEKDLMQIVPREDWTDFTHLMIEYGRTYCPARKHRHEDCPLVL